ncbi:ATP-dependent helicase, partial [Candidatus Woesearchaeota archaeon]
FGRRVNDCLARAIGYAIAKTQKRNVEIGVNDNGFFVRTQRPVNVMAAFKLLKSENFDKLLKVAIDKTEVLKRRFRHCAARALMILRQYKGKQKSVGRQQLGANILLSTIKRIDPKFCILEEARREVLEDLMDVNNAKLVLKWIEDGRIKVEEIFTSSPSPFAFNLVLQSYWDVLKLEDRLEFLRRMHQVVMAKIGKKFGDV